MIASQSGTLDTVVTTPVYVTTQATAGVAAYYPVPLDQSLRGDIGSTQLDSESTNDIYLVYANPFPITNGQILLQNPVPSVPKVLNFLGQGQSTSIITSNYTNRLFEITGTNGTNPSLMVVFQDLTLTGGLATDEADLPLPGILSLGGALLMNGGVAMLSDVAVRSNVALGQTGSGRDGWYVRRAGRAWFERRRRARRRNLSGCRQPYLDRLYDRRQRGPGRTGRHRRPRGRRGVHVPGKHQFLLSHLSLRRAGRRRRPGRHGGRRSRCTSRAAA